MHPEILRELGSQRRNDLRVRAERVRFARTAGKVLRSARRASGAAEEFTVTAIPDYVDGSFKTRAGDAAAARPSRIPAGRKAA